MPAEARAIGPGRRPLRRACPPKPARSGRGEGGWLRHLGRGFRTCRHAEPRPPAPHRRDTARWTVAGVALALVLHALGGWGGVSGAAQSNTTFTESSTSASGFESPPACSEIGSTRQVETLTLTVTVGPGCIGVGNRDVPNPSPACGGLPPAEPDPAFGTTFLVPFGVTNNNINTHTLTLTCVAPTPALPWPWLVGLGAGVLGAGARLVRRRRF